MKHPSTPHRPHPDPEILALAESDAPDCGKEFNPGLCRTRHLAAKAREARGLEHGLCAYCPLILKHLGIVTKSADNDTPTCATCGNTLTKNGFCHSCRSTAQQAREAEKRQMCKTCGKVRVKDGFEYCSYCLKHAGRLKFKLKLEEPKPMTTTEDKPIEKQPAKKRPATCKQCGKPCTFNESGLCRPCSAARNARKAREAKPLSEPAKSTPEPKIEQKPELQRCPKCGKKLTKNGFCYTCAAHEREAKKSKARKPVCKKTAPKVTQEKSNVTLAPKTGAPKTLPNLPASRLCKEFRIQNCHVCDDLACGDNMRKPAADSIHAKSPEPGKVIYDPDPMVQMLPSDRVMPLHSPNDIYRRALRHFGDRHQLNKMAEEASELSAAISRYKNRDASNDETLLIALVEEIADVENLCKQMRLIFGDQPIDAAARMKMERLEREMDK
jgi:hypothetical protein